MTVMTVIFVYRIIPSFDEIYSFFFIFFLSFESFSYLFEM